MLLEKISEWKCKKRIRDFEKGIPLRGIWLRKCIHIICLLIVKIDRFFSKENLELLADKRKNLNNRQRIYACTHIGGNDVQRVFEAISEHAYLFLGDPRDLYVDMAGLLLWCNGCICLETNNRKDREVAYQRAIELLERNGHLLIFPEGTWNISANLPVEGLFPGVIKMAMYTGAEIVPVAIEQYENTFIVNIGEEICCDENTDINDYRRSLRDILASLKFEIWESRGVYNRGVISNSYPRDFVETIIGRCKYGFTADDVKKGIYREKGVTPPEEVFAFMGDLVPSRENAFLFRRN